MATTKSMKIQAEIDKVKAKISEQQARLKELEQKKLEAENSDSYLAMDVSFLLAVL